MVKKHILYFSSFGSFKGGGQRSLFLILNRLNRNKYVPICVAPEQGDFTQKVKKIQVPVFIIPMVSIRLCNILEVVKIIFKIVRIIKKNNVEILHTDGLRNTFYAGIASKLCRAKIVVHVRVEHKPIWQDKLIIFFSNYFIFVSKAAMQRFNLNRMNAPSEIIYNGIDIDEIRNLSKERNKILEEKHIKRCYWIGCVGRVEQAKGQGYLIESFSEIQKLIGKAELIFIGDIDQKYLLKYQKILNTTKNHIKFLGYLENPYPFMSQFDVLVVPTLSEGFSRVIIEAMALSIPVVATACGGNIEAIKNGENGFLIPKKNSKIIAGKVEILVKDEKLKKVFIESGFRSVRNHFTIKENVKQIENIYEKMHTGR